MRYTARYAVPLLLLSLMTACGKPDSGEAASPADIAPATPPSAALEALFNEHFEDSLALNPIRATSIGDERYNDRLANSLSAEYREKSLELEQKYLARLETIDRSGLSEQERLSYDLFKLQREWAIEGAGFPNHLQPINQFGSFASAFVQLGSGKGLHPFRTVKDYDDWLSRIDDFVAIADTAIGNMQAGIEQGIVQPKVLMLKALPQLESQVVAAAEDSGFFAPIVNMPESFGEADRERLTSAYRAAIENEIIPAYERLHNFISDEYMAAARDTVGLDALPGGEDWYAYLVRVRTTTDLTPDEIHQIGLDEVARIHDEMRGVMLELGFEGDLQEFFEFAATDPRFFYDDPEDLIQAYRDMAVEIAEANKALFEVFPKTDYEVRRVEPFREQSASRGSYQAGTPDGSRKGIFYANAYNVGTRSKWNMRSLFLHEAIPGHHYQIMLQRENEELPSFRRFGGVTAYIEGWGLYSESLGKELGVYDDPMDHFGALGDELWRSIRLVVDTGLHAKGWTRQEVLDYMQANSAASETRRVQEAERFMAIPGQALAYKIGQLKIWEIRNRAATRLGDRFDIKAFHTEVLKDGAVPLSMLEAKIDRWIESQL
ncbi:MAG: DUF885 domain-containing protein [Pseudomonadota bacterium]